MIIKLARQAHSALTILMPIGVLLLIAGCGLGLDNAERLERAETAFDNGDYRAATIDAKNILQKEPDNIEARLLLGLASLRLNDGDTAESSLRRAISLGTPPANVAVDLGKALLLNGEFEAILTEIGRELARDQAEKHAIMQLRGDARMGLGLSVVARSVYEEILTEDPNNIEARLGVVSSYEAENDYQAARREVDTVLELNPNRVEAWLASGSVASKAQDSNRAIEHFNHALVLAEDSGDFGNQIAALSGLIESQLNQGSFDAADTSFDRLLELAPNNISTMYLGARIAFMKQDYAAADTALNEVLRIAPSSVSGRLLMGAVQLKLGRLGQAESYISGVIAAAPTSQEARAIMAEIRLLQGRAADVAAILAPAIDTGMASEEIKSLAVRASLQSGQYDTTINYLRDQVAQNPDDQDLQMRLAAALIVAGKREEADAILKENTTDTGEDGFRRDMLRVYASIGPNNNANALREAEILAERYPGDPRAHNLLANVALTLGRLDIARASFLNEQDIVSQSVATYISIANIDLQTGDLDAAREQLVAAHNLQPGSTDILVGLARLEGRAQDSEAARGWLETAQESDPAAMAPRIFLARLLLSANDAAGAEAVAKEALSINAEEPAANNLLGLATERLGRLDDAIKSYEKALKLAPQQAEYRTNLVRAQTDAGYFEQAEQTLTKSGEVDLNNIQQASMVAALRLRQGDLEGALEIAEALKNHNPGSGAPFAVEGELLAADKQYKRASESYDTAIRLSGTNRSFAFRAFSVRQAGDLENPEAPLLVYLLTAPSDIEMRLQAAQSFQNRGESKHAIEHYEQALGLSPDNSNILYDLAREYAKIGDPTRAVMFLERALDGSSEFPRKAEAQQLLDELRK